MFKVTFRFENGEAVEGFAAAEENLLEVARKTNVAIDAPCSGNGSCGKCRVKLLKGTLNSPRTRHITEEEYAEGWRLSCASKVEGDIEVEVPDIASAYRSRMKVADLSSPEEVAIFDNAKADVEAAGIVLKNDMEVVDVTMDAPSLEDTMPDNERLMRALKKQMQVESTEYEFENRKSVILVIGVNGVGKTTSVGKLAGKLKDQGKKVILGAADTFRAAAGEQLAQWASRAGVDLIGGQEGADPASIVYDAVAAAKARNADVLICDTAGRLHNKKNLMEELRKIYRILEREYPEAYLETLVVLDGTTGQNALAQAKQFAEVANVNGIILTKLDGTAKGGIAVAIQSELDIPVKYIGVGETIDDLQKFDADAFVNALFDIDQNELHTEE